MKSMTGFGRGTFAIPAIQQSYKIEISSVNRKFLDVRLNIPNKLSFAETLIRQTLSDHVLRGNLMVRIEPCMNAQAVQQNYQINQSLLETLVETLPALNQKLAQSVEVAPVSASDILSIPGVITEVPPPEIDIENAQKEIKMGLLEAIEAFNLMRKTEGDALKKYFNEQLDRLKILIGKICDKLEEINAQLRQKVLDKIDNLKLSTPIDPARIEQEIFFLAQKADVTEECVRLHSHIEQFKSIIEHPHCGRKLDFLVQEMQREITTLGNKTGHVEVMNDIVDFKTEIERMKEQVQNVE